MLHTSLLSLHNPMQVVMLTTNMIRKDLIGQNMYDAGTALTGLACFISQDLARDLANDTMTLVSCRHGGCGQDDRFCNYSLQVPSQGAVDRL